MDLHLAIPYVTIGVGSAFIFFAPFSRQYRHAPRWIRSGFFIAAPLGLAWSAIGFYLLSHATGDHTDLRWSRFWALDHLHATLGGMGLGILIILVISPDFYRRHDPPERSTS
jgi:amino acid transporter